MINVTVWNENLHEQRQEEVRRIYPDGIHGCIAGFLQREGDFRIRTATYEEPEHGLTEEVLQDTDVLIYWSHMAQESFSDEVAARIHRHVLQGMGLIALHSAHFSKMMKLLLGTTMTLRWQHGDRERLFVTAPAHPIAAGLPQRFELPVEEMYGEYFDIPKPDDVVFTGWFAGGEVFRSGCTFTRGMGKIFYFQPGHEAYPTYHDANVQRVITNAVYWCAPIRKRMEPFDCTAVRVSLESQRESSLKLSVFFDHIREAAEQSGRTEEEVTACCAAAGIRGVEVEYRQFAERENTIRDLLGRNGMEISCFYEFFELGQNPDINHAREVIDKAKELGVERVMIIPGFLKENIATQLAARHYSYEATAEFMSHNEEICSMKTALTQITAYAKEKNVTICMEDFDSVTSPVSRIYQLLWFMKQVPDMKHTLDMGNYAFSDENVLDAFDLLKDYVVHVHCKDRGLEVDMAANRYGRGLAPVAVGDGYIPIAEMVGRLKDIGYTGYFAIEHFGASDQLNYILRSADFLRSL